MKMSGNYDILSLEYRPFAEGAEKREMPWDSPRETAFTWRGINLDSFDQAWELICQYCKSNITEVAYNTWFSRLKPVSLDFDRATAVIEAPNEFHKQTLLRCYSDLLKEAFDNVFGGGISFQICVHEELKQQQAAPDPFEQDDYELTFDTFVVGPSNRFAHAACQAVAAKPALLYNPLFIYGSSGLGKTHLLNAVAKEFKKNFPDRSVIYAKSEDFTNEIIAAIARGTTPAFREKYRKADLFLMDDIQFIAGKNSVQEEFFHTFNTLYEAKKQIVLTSDRPPRDIATLEDRLKTRFEWGLTADVQAPDFETRIAIITRKAESLHLEIPETVCEYIANKLKSNIRQLEGAVKNCGPTTCWRASPSTWPPPKRPSATSSTTPSPPRSPWTRSLKKWPAPMEGSPRRTSAPKSATPTSPRHGRFPCILCGKSPKCPWWKSDRPSGAGTTPP